MSKSDCHTHRIPMILLFMAFAVGSFLLVSGFADLLAGLDTLNRYRLLAPSVLPGIDERSQEASQGGSQDNPTVNLPHNAAAWVTVEGTSISLPVADGSRGYSWYLTHDLWGNSTSLGCPFMDPRCPSADGQHVLVYGHHLSLTSAMFSPLHLCYEQRRFDRLGACNWSTNSGSTSLSPLCALSVSSDWPDIMRFSFEDDDDFRAWLQSIVLSSSAQSDKAIQRAGVVRRVVTLVTCSSNIAGQPWRTLVVFAC